jgi:hypothetical protein
MSGTDASPADHDRDGQLRPVQSKAAVASRFHDDEDSTRWHFLATNMMFNPLHMPAVPKKD